MISAKEAREQSEAKTISKDEEMLNIITKRIEQSIKDGLCYTAGTGLLSSAIVNQLKGLGYSVEQGSQYNEHYYSISW